MTQKTGPRALALFPRFLLLAVLAAVTQTASGTTLYTIGADDFGAPTSLNSMDPGSAASVTIVQTPVGDGSIGFNGGLVFNNGLLYAIGNDSSGDAALYSLSTGGQGLTDISGDFNNTGEASGYGFQNGLAVDGSTFYAIGAGASGEALFQIGNGSATLVRALATLGGTYAGLVYDPALGEFYGLIANGSGDFNGDYLVSFGLTGGTTIVANLTTLDSAEVGSHLDGLADAGGGILYDIYMDPNTNTGQLEQIDLNGPPSTTTLYDTQIPLSVNAGIALDAPTPEPATGPTLGAGLLLTWWLSSRRKKLGLTGR